MPEIRLHTRAELIHCALEPDFVRGIEEELEAKPTSAPLFNPGLRDKSIQRILGMLNEELDARRPLGRLYVDSLAHALVTRLLLLDPARSPRAKCRVSALPLHILKRVQEKIDANLETELSVTSLASETGYSRSHFLRMFRVATGLTPHQYVLSLRLKRAQNSLRHKNSSIIDIALTCGFSSQSHMTSVFRQRLEMTPAEFRRNA